MTETFDAIDVRKLKHFRRMFDVTTIAPFVVVIMVKDQPVGFLSEHNRNYTASFSNRLEATIEASEAAAAGDPYVWVVMKNADFTEGRGPMQLDSIYTDALSAHQYIMQQEGIFGSSQYCEVSGGINVHGNAYASVRYNGYDLRRIKLN